MMAIVDYGLGNVQAFANVYRRLNIPVTVARTAGELAGASRIILPGVGAFDHAVELLDASGMRAELERKVRQERVPVLGICVGMQIIAEGSDEGTAAGLGWIPARVRKFDAAKLPHSTRLPHMGWNDVRARDTAGLFRKLETDARFYFLHSYYFECANPADVLAVADYGVEFSCAVRSGNIYGVQFHPEKSHHCGTQLLRNFAELPATGIH
jgi:imidazole glycerol-phosphate synthase subunit HisH